MTEVEPQRASLGLSPGELRLRCPTETTCLALANIIEFDRGKRQIAPDGSSIPVIKCRQFVDGQAQTSFLGSRDHLLMNLLGRYLRFEYATLRDEVRNLDITRDDIELLVTLYTVKDRTDLVRTLDVEVSVVEKRLQRLEERDLLKETEAGCALTEKGRIIVNQRFESVNS